MANRLRVNFNLRNPNAKTETPIHMILRGWGEDKKQVHNTGQVIHPDRWNKQTQRPKNKRDEIGEILDDMEGRVRRLHKRFVREFERDPEFEELRTLIKNEGSGQRPIWAAFEAVADKPVIKSAQSYRRSMDVWREMFPNLTFGAVDDQLLERAVQKMEPLWSHNTIGRHINRLREVMNYAVNQGLTRNTKWKTFKYSEVKTQPVSLSEYELEILRTAEMPTEQLDNARDLFLVGCWTGLRYSDFSRLTPDHIKDGRIHITTRKTEQSIVVPILPPLRSILDKRGGEFPRPIANQRLNEYIKDACKRIPTFQMEHEIVRHSRGRVVGPRERAPKWTLITTHVARRSFCTNAYRAKLPVHLIMSISGHSTETMLFRYIGIDRTENADEIARKWQPQMNTEMKVAR